jgi:hypothetical protein
MQRCAPSDRDDDAGVRDDDAAGRDRKAAARDASADVRDGVALLQKDDARGLDLMAREEQWERQARAHAHDGDAGKQIEATDAAEQSAIDLEVARSDADATERDLTEVLDRAKLERRANEADRAAAAGDRRRAAGDRVAAQKDRTASAGDRAAAQGDREQAEVDRQIRRP